MNKSRRKKLQSIILKLDELQKGLASAVEDYCESLEEIKEELSGIKEEEEEAFDNMSEGRQDGSIGQDMQERISFMETAYGEIEDLHSTLNDMGEDMLRNAIDALDGAADEPE